MDPPLDRVEPPLSPGRADCLLDVLVGVGGGSFKLFMVSSLFPLLRSSLFPARITVNCGDANALASVRNVGSELKEVCDAMSYTRMAPAAPR